MKLDPKMLERLIAEKLRELERAVGAFDRQTIPHTPMPRPREFEFAPGVVWPHEGDVWLVRADGSAFKLWSFVDGLASRICRICGYQPRKVLRAIRRIEAAASWCRRRAEGRERMAREIVRQQKRAAEVLAAMMVAQKLIQGGKE